METDEVGTRARFNEQLDEVIKPSLDEHRARLVKTMGDGFLVEFGSVVDAVQCAANIQNAIASRQADEAEDMKMLFRMGVHLGDVIVEDEDIHGDGVNIAARLEGLAESGGICISGMVHEGVRNKVALHFTDLGEHALKNISGPVHVYRATTDVAGAVYEHRASVAAILNLPSIAVLPFDNLSGDPEQEYFSDGITEDLITALSHVRRFRVIARNSTFSYKGTSPDIRRVADELQARYVIEGGVRKAGNRVRVTAQLIEGESGNHIWAERYDRDLEDIFALQDELTNTLVGAITPSVGKAEQERARQKPPASLDAWDLYQRGMSQFRKRDRENIDDAQALFEQALQIDPRFAPAHTGCARAFFYRALYGMEEADKERALIAAQKAVELDSKDAEAHVTLSRIYNIKREHEAAISEARMAIELNPSLADAYHLLGSAMLHSGKAQDAVPQLQTAIQLSPHDDLIGAFHGRLALAYLYLGNYENALELAQNAVRFQTSQWTDYTYLLSALGHLEGEDEAKTALQELQRIKPDISVSFVSKYVPTSNNDDLKRLLDGLRKAGLPDKSSEKDEALPLPDKPSIAVLPFENMSGDPEQEYFADGITEDLITALSRIRQFFVIARNTTFTYKGQAVDVQAVAKDLGVRYVLEGSVRKAGNRVRISAQLIDGETGNHIWAERYDRDLDDIFALQDELSMTLAAAIAPALGKAELQRTQLKKPETLDAWDLYQRGLWHLNRRNSADILEATHLFERAMAMDPNFGPAFAGYAWAYRMDYLFGFAKMDLEKARSAALRAVSLDRDDPFSHFALGQIYITERKHEAALEEFQAALQLNPSFADTYHQMAYTLIHLGRPREALDYLASSIRLSPHDVVIGVCYAGYCLAWLYLHEYTQAVEWGRKAIRQPIVPTLSYVFLIPALAYSGNFEEAERVLEQLQAVQPGTSVSSVKDRILTVDPESKEHLLNGLRKAGMPE
jgi:adenylate cyclase